MNSCTSYLLYTVYYILHLFVFFPASFPFIAEIIQYSHSILLKMSAVGGAYCFRAGFSTSDNGLESLGESFRTEPTHMRIAHDCRHWKAERAMCRTARLRWRKPGTHHWNIACALYLSVRENSLVVGRNKCRVFLFYFRGLFSNWKQKEGDLQVFSVSS